jgi:ABC-type transport system involved in multi-copper enzyme maturation permease subunit
MSVDAATVPRVGIPLQVRLRATARSEWIKFWSVRSGPATLVMTALFVLVGGISFTVSYRHSWPTMSAGDKASFDPVYYSLIGITLAQLLVGALGVITVTGEYTSGLIRGTFMATPQRAQVLAVKALIFTAVTWAWCTALSFATFFIGQGVLSSAKHVAIGDPGVLTAVFGGGLYLTLIGLFGLFIGVLLRRTASALIALFVIVLVLPVVVLLVLPTTQSAEVSEYLPSNAGGQIWKLMDGGAHMLGPWQGFGVLCAYVAAVTIAAFVLIRRRDV